MLIYILVLFILFICTLIGFDNDIRRKKLFIIMCFLILTFIAMLRSWEVGVDTEQYYRNFGVISNLGWNQVELTRYEPGYFYLCKVLSCISKDPHILIIVSSLIIIPSIGRFIYKYSINVALSAYTYITLNIYFFHLTGMRQSLAIAILLYGIDFLLENKIYKFILIVLCASLFHSSAIILILLVWIIKFNYTKRTYLNTLIIAGIGFLFYKPIFGITSQILPKYAGYLTSTFGESNYFGALLQLMVGICIYTFCDKLFFYNKFIVNNKRNVNVLALRCVSIAVCLQAMTMRMNIIGRMTPYFWIFSLVAFPKAIDNIRKQNKKYWILITIFVLFLYWLIIGTFRPEWNGAIPYHTLFID